MTNLSYPKKAMKTIALKNKIDWHKADIKAAVEKAGWSLRKLSESNGLCSTALQQGLIKNYPKAQSIIAKAIGVNPQEIWPSRYNQDGSPKKSVRKPRAVCVLPRAKFNSNKEISNVDYL